MLLQQEVPKTVSNLITALSNLNCNNFSWHLNLLQKVCTKNALAFIKCIYLKCSLFQERQQLQLMLIIQLEIFKAQIDISLRILIPLSIEILNFLVKLNTYQNISKEIYLPMYKKVPLILILFLVLTQSVKLFNQQTAQKAFNQGIHYLIHVHLDKTSTYQQPFNQFCKTVKQCAILNPQVQELESVHTFVGFRQKQYFLILDVPKQKKYTLPVKEGMTAQDLHNFWNSFKANELSQFLSSQDAPKDQSDKALRKIVGSTLDDFLQHQAPIKVLFQYTDRPQCQVCQKMMEGFNEMAQNVSNEQIIIFGYIDIFKNDHPKIESTIVPHFLIFTKSRNNQPIDVQATRFGDLFDEVLAVVKEVVKPQRFDDIKRQAQVEIANHEIEQQFQKDDQQQKQKAQEGQL